MAGVSWGVWGRTDADAYVPGIMSLIPDQSVGSASAPLPLAAGPICGQCWIDRRRVTAVGQRHGELLCPHGGAS